MAAKRRPRGSVAIEDFGGMLRLRWRAGGRRFALALGLPADSAVNQAIAQQRAISIQLDLVSGNFDPTLEKYRGATIDQPDRERVLDLWERYCQHKARMVTSARTMEKYRALGQHLTQSGLAGRPVATVNQAIALHFVGYLRDRLAPRTAREHLTNLAACWRWADHDPGVWEMARSPVKVSPRQKDRPFSEQEIGAILLGFQSHFPHYLPFVQFLLGTGCRIGEARGLLWRHVDQDCRTVWIGETLDRFGQRRPTKNRAARTVVLPDSLRSMMANLRRGRSEDLVFPGPRGEAIDDHNFSRRIWRKVLADQNIPYRKPRITRHTVVSHAVAAGANVADLAAQTGHTARVLLQDYLSPLGRPVLPDLGRSPLPARPPDDFPADGSSPENLP
jgi:integrase